MPGHTQGQLPPVEDLAEKFVAFCQVVAKLRGPDGCPWDRVQTLQSIKPYTLEETYELLEAIDDNDNAAIQEELGDVLLQVILYSQIAADEQRFQVTDVLAGITSKMIHRHPHVFGDVKAESASEVRQHWEKAKNPEKAQRKSIFEGLPKDLPALAKAKSITKKAASVGYDFPNRDMLFDKLTEEIQELQAELYPEGQIPDVAASVEGAIVPDTAVQDPERLERIEEELGDVLFVIANIARRWGVNPEEALRKSNSKFVRRVQYIEKQVKEQGQQLAETSLQEMERLYQQGKRGESAVSSRTHHEEQPE